MLLLFQRNMKRHSASGMKGNSAGAAGGESPSQKQPDHGQGLLPHPFFVGAGGVYSPLLLPPRPLSRQKDVEITATKRAAVPSSPLRRRSCGLFASLTSHSSSLPKTIFCCTSCWPCPLTFFCPLPKTIPGCQAMCHPRCVPTTECDGWLQKTDSQPEQASYAEHPANFSPQVQQQPLMPYYGCAARPRNPARSSCSHLTRSLSCSSRGRLSCLLRGLLQPKHAVSCLCFSHRAASP